MVHVYALPDGGALPLKTGVEYERRQWEAGWTHVAGLDEVGRGALAGPVVAAAVILPPCTAVPPALAGVTDSKLLSPEKRAELFDVIVAHAYAYGVGAVPAAEIDRIGIAPATRAAMLAAVRALAHPPQAVLIDFLKLPELDCPQESIIRGDLVSLSIAAASIIAKVTRDRWMVEADATYPGYGLSQHKGYGTAQHLVALKSLGPCPLHRRYFEPLAGWLANPTDAGDE
jgi:ribonuclease HII